MLEENGWRPSSECVSEGFGCKKTSGTAEICRRQEDKKSMCVEAKLENDQGAAALEAAYYIPSRVTIDDPLRRRRLFSR